MFIVKLCRSAEITLCVLAGTVPCSTVFKLAIPADGYRADYICGGFV
jgi:hypothetical protein